MKKCTALLLAFLMILSMTACGGDSDTETETTAEVLSLVGNWEQEELGDSYQAGYITEDTIEIFWISDGGETAALYWSGTYEAPDEDTDSYSWDSVNDTSRTGSALLASGDDTKTFTYEDGVLSYPVTALGVTSTYELVPTDTDYSVFGPADSTTDSGDEVEEETYVSADVSITETELFNNGSVSVTATELTSGLLGEEISLTVVNDSEADLVVSLDELVVNDYSLQTSGGYVDVGAGKTAYDCIYLYSSELESCGIDTIAVVSFQIRLIDDDTYDTLETSDRIEIVTSVGAEYEQSVDDSGTVVCEMDGIRIIYQGMNDDSIWDGELVFFVENTTEKDIYVYADDVAINDIMVDASFGPDVLAGTMCVDSLYVIDIEDLGIESMDEATTLTCSLRIVDSDTWDTIGEQDVTLNFEE